ncbi:acyl-CoA reductase [Psychromonas sp. L1A2]|uniref:acyl-CoA reductase n=1 Tax=Psychromonas sp. L1A2 TaxID=2686356 RepID=UPI001358B9B8|nr:acyl-CoA reductase [Psychromonas sp. L1A2]
MSQLIQLGEFLMTNGRAEPSIVAAGYWLRKSHLLSIKAEYPISQLKAKGAVFHIAPGNVDTLFFYSMIISVLCGNQTILRVSNNVSAEAQTLLDLLNQFNAQLETEHVIASLLTVIQYQRDDIITAKISSACDSRVIWGGNESIDHICQFPLVNGNSDNICFPDRYSVAVIQLKDEVEINSAVDNLLRDIKPYHQQACSSPKVVYWLNTAHSLQDKFWLLLDQRLSQQKSLEATELIAQLLYIQRLPLLLSADKVDKNKCLLKKYDLLQVLEIESISLNSIKSHSGLWVLLSLQINSLGDIELFEHCQTMTVSGFDKSQCKHWQSTTLQPLKRIVPAGQALAFSHLWDGVNLIENLTS